MESPVAAPSVRPRLDRLTSPGAAAVVLVLFWLLLVASTWNKSATIDEPGTPAAGITHWKLNDYRLDPENGNLPHRLAALPLLGTQLPPLTGQGWLNPEPWNFGYDWLHLPNNEVEGILRRGRAMMALVAVTLAALVWLGSRRLFGPVGGMISLLLCVLNPTILANGPLMTADTLVALFFLAAIWSWWRLLQRITPGRLALGILATGGLLGSKMSGILIAPMVLLLIGARLADGRPLEVSGWGRDGVLRSRWRQAGAILAVGVVQTVAVFGILWGCYGFRYAMMAPGLPSTSGSAYLWEPVLAPPSLPEAIERLSLPREVLLRARAVVDKYSVPLEGVSKPAELAGAELRRDVLTPAQAAALQERMSEATPRGVSRLIMFLARHEVLPEAYLLGALHAVRSTNMRWAFLNGETYHIGTPWFFPYTFAVKTPLPFLGLLVLAAAAVWAGRRRVPPGWSAEMSYHGLPFAILFLGYGLSMVTSGINIGHRHILTLYPPLFILGGAAGLWLETPGFFATTASGSRWVGRTAVAVWSLLLVQGLEIAGRFPDYLAYFNGVVSPTGAYRHLVDSSLDWGQDLPGVRTYLEVHAAEGPFHLAYFGAGNPQTYGIAADFLPSQPGRFRDASRPVIVAPIASATPTAEETESLRRQYPGHAVVAAGTNDQGQPRAVLIRRPANWRLSGGTYLISATLLQLKPWRESDEADYQALRRRAQPLVAPASRDELLAALNQYSAKEEGALLGDFEEARMNRLAAFLRSYTPDASVGHSILIYKMTDADLAQALDGPPPFRIPDRGQTLHPGL